MEMLIFFSSRTLAPAHTAKSTSQWFADHHITMLDWPDNMPDLIPIWNPRDIFKRKMSNSESNNTDELKLEFVLREPRPSIEWINNNTIILIIIIKLRLALFVTYTIIQSITSSEMCSLHLTHPSAHTHTHLEQCTHTHTHLEQCTHTHTHLEQWAADAAGSPGSSRGFGALLKGLTSVVDNSCRSRDSNPQPRVTSPSLYPLEPRL